MRLNLNNAISFVAHNEREIEFKSKEELENYTKKYIDFDKRMYFCEKRKKSIYKPMLVLDFGQFKKSVHFDTVEDMENFIFKVFPQNYGGVSCINDYE